MTDSAYWILFAVLGLGNGLAWVHGRSQDRIGRVERKLDALLRHFDIEVPLGFDVSDRVKELARDPSKKIEAIKLYRAETGSGLAESKEAVEAFIGGR